MKGMNSTIINIINTCTAMDAEKKQEMKLMRLMKEQSKKEMEEYNKWRDTIDFSEMMKVLAYCPNWIFNDEVAENKGFSNHSEDNHDYWPGFVEMGMGIEEEEAHKIRVMNSKRSKRRNYMKRDKAKHGLPKYYRRDYKAKLYLSGDKHDYTTTHWKEIELASF